MEPKAVTHIRINMRRCVFEACLGNGSIGERTGLLNVHGSRRNVKACVGDGHAGQSAQRWKWKRATVIPSARRRAPTCERTLRDDDNAQRQRVRRGRRQRPWESLVA